MKRLFITRRTYSFFVANRKLAAFFLSTLMLVSTFAFSLLLPSVFAASAGNIMDFYVTAKSDFGGQGFNVFSPQMLVVQQGDQVNLTIRNMANQTFHLQIEKAGSRYRGAGNPKRLSIDACGYDDSIVYGFVIGNFQLLRCGAA